MTQTYKLQTIKNLSKLTMGKWYQVNNRPDYTDLLKLIEWLIAKGIRYEISPDRNNIRLADDIFAVEVIEKGYMEEININGTVYPLVNESGSYRLYRGEKLVEIGRV